jgi:glycosyltransferase involved in cell wall biosynthesis
MKDRPIKILVFCSYFYPHEGGVEKYVSKLFKDLKSKDAVIDVTIVTANTERSVGYEVRDGFKIYRLPCWHMLNDTYPVIKPSGWSTLKKLSPEGSNKYDFVITNTRFFNTSFLGLCFSKKHKIPLIHIEHGTCHSSLLNPISKSINVLYDHTIGRYIIKHCYRLVAISDAAKRFCQHLYKKDKTFIVRNSIEAKSFNQASTRNIIKTKKSLGIKDEKIIIFVGRLIFAKGVQDLLNATKDMQEVKVLIIGDGNHSEYLKSMNKNVLFLGRMNQEQIIKYLSIADIFVNPSYSEGLPTSVLEAGAIGLPIIATDVGGTREIIDDGLNGFLIKPKGVELLRDKISLLLEDQRLCSKFSIAIKRKIYKEFDWAIARKAMLNLLKIRKV